VEAAREAGAKAALIPRENWNDRYGDMGMPVYAIDTLADAIAYATASAEGEPAASGAAEGVLIAKGAEI
jgi:predicted S18 family serine protease